MDKIERWVVAAQRTKLEKALNRSGQISQKQALSLQLITIGIHQQTVKPELQLYPRWQGNLAKEIQRFKQQGILELQHQHYHRKSKGYAFLGLRLTEKGMKALSRAGGTVFLTAPRE